jgi:hypothetical protein
MHVDHRRRSAPKFRAIPNLFVSKRLRLLSIPSNDRIFHLSGKSLDNCSIPRQYRGRRPRYNGAEAGRSSVKTKRGLSIRGAAPEAGPATTQMFRAEQKQLRVMLWRGANLPRDLQDGFLVRSRELLAA